MDRIFLSAVLAACCCALWAAQSDAAPVMSYFNVSNKPIQPRAPQAKQIVPLPYREPAPVHEAPVEQDLEDDRDLENEIVDEPVTKLEHRVYKPYQPPRDQRLYRPYKALKYGFVNTKTGVYDPRAAYNYNKRYIYTNYIY